MPRQPDLVCRCAVERHHRRRACRHDRAGDATTTTPGDGGWPRAYTTPTGARLVLYQPQVESWPDQKQMTLYAAVSYLAKANRLRRSVRFEIESDTSVALADRLVNFSEFMITESNFPTSRRTN